jgi:hypothetical protein
MRSAAAGRAAGSVVSGGGNVIRIHLSAILVLYIREKTLSGKVLRA